MTASNPERPNWSRRLPERGPGALGPMPEGGGPVFALYLAAVRVEVDPDTEEVIEVIVDEATMEEPAMVARYDGSTVAGADRDRVRAVLARSEWPSWDYGTARHGPTMST